MIYALILRLRHLFYDKGWKKSFPTTLPSVCIGNVAVGGTGKTPMTELVINTLKYGEIEAADSEIYGFSGPDPSYEPKKLAVLSRGYKRRTKGFQQVVCEGSAAAFGDEALQIKRKFPECTVVVDEDRVEGASFLAKPELIDHLKERKKARILHPQFNSPEFIILDDAYQHRRIKASGNIVLTAFDRPFTKDRLLPFGRLRDLRSRAYLADMVVVTKCPLYMDETLKCEYAAMLGFKDYDPESCSARAPKCRRYPDGKEIKLLFATLVYDKMQGVFPEADPHYTHAQMAIAITGIANSKHFVGHLGDMYRIISHESFADHHAFTRSDAKRLESAVEVNPTCLLATTEKDAQRLRDLNLSAEVRRRLFYIPIRMQMLTAAEQRCLKDFLLHL